MLCVTKKNLYLCNNFVYTLSKETHLCTNPLSVHTMASPIRFILTLSFLLTTIAVAADEDTETVYTTSNGMSSSICKGVVQDRNGLMWFATWNGLDVFDGYQFRSVKVRPGDGSAMPDNRMRGLRLNDDGNLLCRTDNGVFLFNTSTYTFQKRIEGKSHHVGDYWTKEMNDRQWNKWTVTDHGVKKTSHIHYPAKKLTATDGLYTRGLCLMSDRTLWVSTRDDQTLRRYDMKGNLLSSQNINQRIYKILETRNGSVWLGCKPGALIRTDKNLKKTETVSSDITYDIKEDSKGRLWIAAFDGGVKVCCNPNAEKPALSASLGGTHVKCILVTREGNIIASTRNGILVGKINEKNPEKTRLRLLSRNGNDANSLVSNDVASLEQDSKGNIYIATETNGIDMISEENLMSNAPKFTHINSRTNELPKDYCMAIKMVNDTTLMVVGTDNITLYNPFSDKAINYNASFFDKDCHFAEGTPLVMPDKGIVVGTENGALMVTGHSMYSRGVIPPLLWKSIRVNGGEEDFIRIKSGKLTLSQEERDIVLSFTAIDYTDNSGIIYRTRINGGRWSAASSTRELNMLNMTPGTYVLEIQSTDHYGRWVDNIQRMTITLKPYWYETWWAFALQLLAIVAIAVGITAVTLYIRRLRQQKSELLQKYLDIIAIKDYTEEKNNAQEVATEEEKEEEKEVTTPLSETANNFSISKEDERFLDKVRLYIEDNIGNSEANIDDMASFAATSRSTLNRRLRSLLGVTAMQLLIDTRLKRARHLLTHGNFTVTEVAYSCGYEDAHYFSKAYKKKFNEPPTKTTTE